MSVVVYRCRHHPDELNERFTELFDQCDVLFVESGYLYEKDKILLKKHLNRLSFQGSSPFFLNPSQLYYDFNRKLEKIITNSRKRIEVERWYDKSDEILQLVRDVKRAENTTETLAFIKGDLEKACKTFVRHAELLGIVIKERDECMAKQLMEILKENSDARILAPIGAQHTLHRLLREEGIHVREELPHKPYTFFLFEEVRRRISFKLPYDDELIARAIAELPLGAYFIDSGLPYRKCIELSRRIAEGLSYADVEDMCGFVSRYPEFYPEACVVWLKREKGIDLTNPTSFYKRQEL